MGQETAGRVPAQEAATYPELHESGNEFCGGQLLAPHLFCVYSISRLCGPSKVRGWSATENNTNNAWRVRFSDGDVNNNNKDNSNYVRCVKGDR